MNLDISPTLLESVRQIARRAGDAIMEVYSREFAVELKDDRSPLTEADKAAHTIIAAGLAALAEPLPILSEESSADDISGRRGWSTYWLVDPLDGTKEFIKRNGEFTVNIALIHNHEPKLGVVYAPAIDRLYSGVVGAGAWLEGDGEAASAIQTQPLSSRPLRVVGSRSHASDALAGYLASLGAHSMVPMGSSLKICLVAEGKADVYPRLGPTSEWDTAAAHAVLLSAGGGMIDTAGEPLRYNTKDDLLNPHFVAYGDGTRSWLS